MASRRRVRVNRLQQLNTHAFHVSAELEELCEGSQAGDTDDEENFAELELVAFTADSRFRRQIWLFSLLFNGLLSWWILPSSDDDVSLT